MAYSGTKPKHFIRTLVRGSTRLIDVQRIKFFKADTKYIDVTYVDDEGTTREVLLTSSLKALEAEEWADQFIRIHRNCLVRKSAIVGVDRVQTATSKDAAQVVLEGDVTLSISRRHVAEVRAYVRSVA